MSAKVLVILVGAAGCLVREGPIPLLSYRIGARPFVLHRTRSTVDKQRVPSCSTLALFYCYLSETLIGRLCKGTVALVRVQSPHGNVLGPFVNDIFRIRRLHRIA